MKYFVFVLILALIFVPASAQEIRAESGSVKVGETVNLSVYGINITKVAGIHLKINFDPSVVKLVSADVNKHGCMFYDNKNESFYSFVLICTNPISVENESLVTLTFKGLREGNSPIDIYAELSVDENGSLKLVKPNVVNGFLKVSTEQTSTSSQPSTTHSISTSTTVPTTILKTNLPVTTTTTVVETTAITTNLVTTTPTQQTILQSTTIPTNTNAEQIITGTPERTTEIRTTMTKQIPFLNIPITITTVMVTLYIKRKILK